MLSTILYFLAFAALLSLVILLPKQKKVKRLGIIFLALILCFEIFVANFHSFHLAFGEYGKQTVDLSATSVTQTHSSATTTVEIRDINQPVGTLYLDCSLPPVSNDSLGTPYVNVTVDAKDATQQGYYRSSVAKGQIVRGANRTAYLVLDLSGDVTDLRIRLTPKEDCTFALNAITLNAPVPMQLSLLRLLLPAALGSLLYLLLTHPAMTSPFGERRRLTYGIALGTTALLMLAAVAMTFLYQYDRTGAISEGFALTYGNQITQELVDAFEAGQVSLLDTPSEELLALSNPYDWSERVNAGIPYKWDHLLFEGKYYSYYGIAPVLLLFLPYHLITGYYFPTAEAVLLFGAIGILFLSLLYLAFCDLFAKRIPVNMILTGLLVCQLSSGVWYNFLSPLFYEIAQASGFCFTCMGFWFLLRSGVIGDGELRYAPLLFSGICLSLAVLCRPTLALYCIVALIFLFFGLLKHLRRLSYRYPDEAKKRRRAVAGYLTCALSGFVLFGALQMLYNFARFGSFFDFGIQYSLTINDFTKSQYHTDFVMIGLHNFLFAFPSVQPRFPYVFSNFSTLDTNGYYFIANRNAVGILFRALPSLGLFGIPLAWKALSKQERIQALCLLIPTCLLVPLGIIFSIWESGYGVRYCTDFAWQLILGGIAVLYLLYARRAERQTKTLLQCFFALSFVVALVCNFGMLYDYMSKGGYLESGFLTFSRIFDFWK